jgi:tRNA (guanine37-N1)-methyltransferase
MRIDVITLFPESLEELTGLGVTGRAIRDGRVKLKAWNPRDLATDRHRTVDDRPYGGGPGMVMAVEPLSATIRAARKEQAGEARVSLMSPQGRRLDQSGINELAGRQGLILVCGRYEGIDERVIESEIDEEWSIGDYVISGGELAAAVIIDAVTRLLPGVLGDEQSAVEDSFMDGLLDHPHYTRPEMAGEKAVPEVLLSGDHEAIRRWRRKQALGRTWQRRPDLLQDRELDEEAKLLLKEFRLELEHTLKP